jgi:putative ABC transport system permease protein
VFNLENEIKEWKRKLRRNPSFDDGDIAELESHVREEVDRLLIKGMTEQEAFERAVSDIGPIGQLKHEWSKTRFSSSVKQQKYRIGQSLTSLFPSYIITAFRNIKKRLGYSLINIIGLSTGLATCILILFFVNHELSYDKFYDDADQIYRIVTSTSDDGTPTNANGIFGTGPLLKKDFLNEIEEYGRIRRTVHNSKMYVAYEQNKFYEDKFYFADPGFLKLFNFSLLKGDPANALSRPNTIIVTKKMARKYFGDVDPMGKTITADPYQDGNLMEFEVTGVMENLPANTHFDFEFLASFESQLEDGLQTHMSGLTGNYTYLKLVETTNPEQLESKFLDFLHRNWSEDPWYTISLQPVTDIHLHSHLKSEIEANGNINYVYIFGAVAILILAIACINFINLTTARSTERAREVGVRKALGAHKRQLIGQFLGEALVMTLVSGLVAILLVYFFLPFFNSLTQKEFYLAEFLSTANLAGYVGFLIVLGVIAGFYPAIVLSSFKSVDVLKSQYRGISGGSWLRKGLVVSQFAVSAILIISTIIIYQQIELINNKSLGYAREQILTIPLNPEARDNFEVLKSEWTRHSGVQNVTSSSTVPTSGTSHSTFEISGFEESSSYVELYIDADFVETYDLELLAGSDIATPVTEPGKADFLASELVAREAGLENPEDLLGRKVNWDEYSGTIKGVVNDMILYDLRQQPYSIMFLITPVQYHKFVSIRINTARMQQALAYIEETWNSQVSSYPMEYSFLDDKFEDMHLSDQKMARTVTYFALLAIVIACLGLFGLAAYIAERKRKEIGVRKVLGASVPQIIRLLSFDFMKLVLVALLVGIPVAYWSMSQWLKGFVYKVDVSAEAFVYAGFLLLLITFGTISYQAIKSAKMNPVNSLRSE